MFVEQLEKDPRFLPDVTDHISGGEVVDINLNQPMDEVRKTLSQYPVKTRVNLSGTIIVARDLAHSKIRARLEAGEPMPILRITRFTMQAPPKRLRAMRVDLWPHHRWSHG